MPASRTWVPVVLLLAVTTPTLTHAKGGGRGGAACMVSYCDQDMLETGSDWAQAWHIPDLRETGVQWPITEDNKVQAARIVTQNSTDSTQRSIVRYGDFCPVLQKQTTWAFVKSVGESAPATPAPSWYGKIPRADLSGGWLEGNLKGGASYRLDVTLGDLKAVNQYASFCLQQCRTETGGSGQLACKYAAYGWEPEAGWFCKLYAKSVCEGGSPYFRPTPVALPVSTPDGPSSTYPVNIYGYGGCRLTDTIPLNTSYLGNPTDSLTIDPSTRNMAPGEKLPYLDPENYKNVDGSNKTDKDVIAAIKCDVPDGVMSPGIPMFGVVWS